MLVRWATLLVGVVLTASDAHRTTPEITVSATLGAYAAVRTVFPLRWRTSRSGLAGVATEAVLCCLTVAATGYWSSPFVFTIVTGVVAAGFGGGFALAVPLAAIASAVVTAASFNNTDALLRVSTEGTTELVLSALVAGYGRRLFGEAERRTSNALNRLDALTETNGLLQQLNAVAQTLPASLDLRETVSETIGQIRALVRPDCIAVFLWDPSISEWSVVGAEGVRTPAIVEERDLPGPLRSAARRGLGDPRAVLADLRVDGPGLAPASRIGIYAPLVARRALIGVIVIESQAADGLAPTHLGLMTGVAEQAALAIDNALWFGRLRTIGAEEERNRIARDLHDRVAQTLAYLAFELDRIVDLSSKQAVTSELDALRHDVRRVVTEVRDMLYDLRTDVSDVQDLTGTMEAFLERVQRRSSLDISFVHRVERRLAIPLEREIWRIGQEAVTNAERHARAGRLEVEWIVTSTEARLTIADDGQGFPFGASGRLDSYGLLGMRERADAIGATLEIESVVGHGTSVRCNVEVK